jgi:eukaryotic-like serine/threonine-protein kinase
MAMPNARALHGAHSTLSAAAPMTLRSLLDARRAEGRRLSIEEAVAVIVPVCLDLQRRHTQGERFLVHPSAIAPGADGVARIELGLAGPPTHPFDRCCLAPEVLRASEPGDACASVFSMGAILYEMLTGQSVGPGMARPRSVDPTLPEALEVLIGAAVAADRADRPADLGALASVMYQLAAPNPPSHPVAEAARMDPAYEAGIDVRFSAVPQPQAFPPSTEGSGVNAVPDAPRLPRMGGNDPFGGPVVDRSQAASPASANRRSADDATSRLAALKTQLESDPRPRYVVKRDKMDHGPFSAVELLQQIASHAFSDADGLRDEISGQNFPIGEWEEFAPFAEQAGLLREKRAQQKAVVRAVDADKKRGLAKTIVAVSCVLALAGVLAVWFFTRRGTRNEDVIVSKDRPGTIEVNGDIKGRKRPGGGGRTAGGGGFSGGMSYEAVLNSNNESLSMGGESTGPDLTNAQLAAPLRHAAFVVSCGAPDDMKVQVRVAVRMGAPVGVTVTTSPSNGSIAACIDRAVRGIRWPANPRTDFVTTNY